MGISACRVTAAILVISLIGACSMSFSRPDDRSREVERALRGEAPLTIDLRQPPTRDALWMRPAQSTRGIGNTGGKPLIDVIVYLPGEERFEIEASDLFIAADGPNRDTTANPGRLSVFSDHAEVDEAFDHLLSYSDLFDMDRETIRQFRESAHRVVEEAQTGTRFSASNRVTDLGVFGDVNVQVQVATRPDARTSIEFMFAWAPLPYEPVG